MYIVVSKYVLKFKEKYEVLFEILEFRGKVLMYEFCVCNKCLFYFIEFNN